MSSNDCGEHHAEGKWCGENGYLNLIRHVLAHGEHRPDRTGTGTYSVFAPPPLKFKLHKPFKSSFDSQVPVIPLLTTKKVFTRAVILELLWFISGQTSSKTLSDQGVKIWDGNSTRKFLDSVGLTQHEEGDLGPIYGFQWRHFGAEYKNPQADYSGQGFDQLSDVVHKLRTNPFDRRIILSAWNPADIPKMALPPCHMFAQFYVSYSTSSNLSNVPNHIQSEKLNSPGILNCQLYQRSCDIGLGVPFNIASYAFLTHMLAHVADLQPGSLTHVMGDAHIYLDHVDSLKVQVERVPRPLPCLKILKDKPCEIDGWNLSDFEIIGYNPHPALSMKMAV